MRKRNAFLKGYQDQEMFREGLGEFDVAREVVMDLIAEYEEAETEGYLGQPTSTSNPNTTTTN